MWSHVAPTKLTWWCLLAPESTILGLFAPFWAKLGWTIAATVHQFGPTSHSIFFFYMDPLLNDRGPRLCLKVSKTGPPMGPNGIRSVFKPLG